MCSPCSAGWCCEQPSCRRWYASCLLRRRPTALAPVTPLQSSTTAHRVIASLGFSLSAPFMAAFGTVRYVLTWLHATVSSRSTWVCLFLCGGAARRCSRALARLSRRAHSLCDHVLRVRGTDIAPQHVAAKADCVAAAVVTRRWQERG